MRAEPGGAFVFCALLLVRGFCCRAIRWRVVSLSMWGAMVGLTGRLAEDDRVKLTSWPGLLTRPW